MKFINFLNSTKNFFLNFSLISKNLNIFNIKIGFRNKFIFFFDLILLFLVFISLFYDISILIYTLFEKLNSLYIALTNGTDFIINMSSNPQSTSTYETKILHDHSGWSDSVKRIFVYGTGVFRLSLLRNGGTPASRAFVIGSTIVVDAGQKALENALNDPEYVEKHIKS